MVEVFCNNALIYKGIYINKNSTVHSLVREDNVLSKSWRFVSISWQGVLEFASLLRWFAYHP